MAATSITPPIYKAKPKTGIPKNRFSRFRNLSTLPSFINKYKSVRIKRRLCPFPFFARLRHVFAVLLAGVQRFFYS
jgi:hypothetical protein